MKARTIIRNARILGSSGLKDLTIENGRFTCVTDAGVHDSNSPQLQVVDIEGKVVLPGLVDVHMHLDKTLTWPAIKNYSGTLSEAIWRFEDAQNQMDVNSITERMTATILKAIKHGTTAIRTHLNYSTSSYLHNVVEAFQKVKSCLSDFITLEAVLMCPFDITKDVEKDIRWAINNGINLLGGAPHLAENPKVNLAKIFEIAVSLDVNIDLHIDESDDPTVKSLEDVCNWTIQTDYQGRVVAGHCTSLSAMGESEAHELMSLVRKAQIGIVTLPSSNLFLMGRQDRGLIRRGLTRVKQLLELNIPVAAASDNIQDPFHPYGKADLLQIALLTSYGAHLTAEEEMEKLLEMITSVPAGLMNLQCYGIGVGNWADFVILDSTDIKMILPELPSSRETWRRGQPICRVSESVSWENKLNPAFT
ncbi:amidohydrolase family protein [Neobacillus mesonae]|uniref:amidohydrolase family protein n=1 Tax=Neobacillus mesonae TaxID=1193713 RepID=UPI002572E8A5|nr:amidohydrolase family protein [Neobacillus mesonae]MED4206379.1 amidohydrolase family protein [Neobacillus mesonae]